MNMTHLTEKDEIILEKWILSKKMERVKKLVAYSSNNLNPDLLLKNFSDCKKI